MDKTKVLVLGGAGFVGSNICNRLYNSYSYKYDVTAVDNLSFGNVENLSGNINLNNSDVEDITAHYLNSFDVVISSYCSNIIFAQNNEIETFKNNAIKFAGLCEKFDGKIINLSTASLYNNATEFPTPETAKVHTYYAYDSSKLIAELFLEQRYNYTTLRLSNVIGKNQRSDNPYSGVLCKFIKNISEGLPIKIYGDGSATRDYTAVDDVVEAVLLCLELPALNDVFNISSCVETSILELVAIVEQCVGRKALIEFCEPRMIDGIQRRWISNEKAKNALGWSPKADLVSEIKKLVTAQR